MRASAFAADPHMSDAKAAQSLGMSLRTFQSRYVHPLAGDDELAMASIRRGKHSGPRGWLTVLAAWRAGTG